MKKLLTPLGGALTCGALPIVTGTLVLLGWLIVQINLWERAWLWMIAFAIPCFVTGVVCLFRHARQKRVDRTSWPTWVAALVLSLNIPIAVLYISIAIHVTSRYSVEVQNAGTEQLDAFRISGPGVDDLNLGPVRPGESVERTLHLTGDGQLQYSISQGPHEAKGILDPSAGPNCGGRRRVRVEAGGRCEVGPLRPFGQR
ncbi:MAG: hypothetical protein U1G07_08615 [Verrucomicrobiota bacterium]